ncbi:hypothetical protein L202_05214 [Cryptococcus amylolentus CBS 6039]|uniref:Uncharacterized protein n=1 Tax=Cryptococcus amylolentus CBS 6039 TaxID=1295533 RepID=A0A1E3HJM3_9TREE|nr:hypothetical protein L202_05214 [Cryptococcus amylolentus CBS 6039]ODN76552.1 hypothetical protein L202_05214 [Cryptococcus amylolentus CBS 6039]
MPHIIRQMSSCTVPSLCIAHILSSNQLEKCPTQVKIFTVTGAGGHVVLQARAWSLVGVGAYLPMRRGKGWPTTLSSSGWRSNCTKNTGANEIHRLHAIHVHSEELEVVQGAEAEGEDEVVLKESQGVGVWNPRVRVAKAVVPETRKLVGIVSEDMSEPLTTSVPLNNSERPASSPSQTHGCSPHHFPLLPFLEYHISQWSRAAAGVANLHQRTREALFSTPERHQRHFHHDAQHYNDYSSTVLVPSDSNVTLRATLTDLVIGFPPLHHLFTIDKPPPRSPSSNVIPDTLAEHCGAVTAVYDTRLYTPTAPIQSAASNQPMVMIRIILGDGKIFDVSSGASGV